MEVALATAASGPSECAQKNHPPGVHGQAVGLARAETGLRNTPGSKRVVKKVLRFEGRAVALIDRANS
jgi:hypothetical protein